MQSYTDALADRLYVGYAAERLCRAVEDALTLEQIAPAVAGALERCARELRERLASVAQDDQTYADVA